MENKKKKIILDTSKDLVKNFLYYDRKDDEELKRGDIQKAVKEGVLSKGDIIGAFVDELESWW